MITFLLKFFKASIISIKSIIGSILNFFKFRSILSRFKLFGKITKLNPEEFSRLIKAINFKKLVRTFDIVDSTDLLEILDILFKLGLISLFAYRMLRLHKYLYKTYGIPLHAVCLLISKILATIYHINQLYFYIVITKLVMDQIIAINPYIWPFSVIKAIVAPYSKLCAKLMPPTFFIPKRMFSDYLGLYFLNKTIPKFFTRWSNIFYHYYLGGLLSDKW